MPTRAPVFKPQNPRIGAPTSYSGLRPERPSAAARGYCSKAWRGKHAQEGLGGLRGAVYRRDKGFCQACGRLCVPKAEDRGLWPHIDHIVPKDQGGSDEPGNLQVLCGACHSSKTDTEDRTHRGQG